MKREIKFRAYQRDKKQMYWFDIMWGNHNKGDGYVGMVMWGEEQSNNSRHRGNMILVDPTDCDLMQYTGLKDKSGKEIYEGDIISGKWINRDYGIAVVEWKVDSMQFMAIAKNENMVGSCALCNWTPKINLEVVGNIYEHPNLLTHEK